MILRDFYIESYCPHCIEENDKTLHSFSFVYIYDFDPDFISKDRFVYICVSCKRFLIADLKKKKLLKWNLNDLAEYQCELFWNNSTLQIKWEFIKKLLASTIKLLEYKEWSSKQIFSRAYEMFLARSWNEIDEFFQYLIEECFKGVLIPQYTSHRTHTL